MCPLLSNGLYYQPLCCALRTLWSMAKRDVADLLPSWLGGPSGEVESPVAFVLVRAKRLDEYRCAGTTASAVICRCVGKAGCSWAPAAACLLCLLGATTSGIAGNQLPSLPPPLCPCGAALPLQQQLRAAGGRGRGVCQ